MSKGLEAGDKCVCFIDEPSSVRDRIPKDLLLRDDILQIFTEEEGYLDGGLFSKSAFIRNLEATAKEALSAGYDRLRLLGDTSVIPRSGVNQ